MYLLKIKSIISTIFEFYNYCIFSSYTPCILGNSKSCQNRNYISLFHMFEENKNQQMSKNVNASSVRSDYRYEYRKFYISATNIFSIDNNDNMFGMPVKEKEFYRYLNAEQGCNWCKFCNCIVNKLRGHALLKSIRCKI